MLEKLKAEVLLAFQELDRCGLEKCGRGIVSAIDRDGGHLVVKSADGAFVTDLQGNVLEGIGNLSTDIPAHFAIYRAFPLVKSVVRPHARFATIFAQLGMNIPVLGSFHKERFCRMIPCVGSVSDLFDAFHAQNIDPVKTQAALVLSHSAYAWGETALDAVANAAALEETANMAYLTMQLDPGIQSVQI